LNSLLIIGVGASRGYNWTRKERKTYDVSIPTKAKQTRNAPLSLFILPTGVAYFTLPKEEIVLNSLPGREKNVASWRGT
jgi:hypothetical protein